MAHRNKSLFRSEFIFILPFLYFLFFLAFQSNAQNKEFKKTDFPDKKEELKKAVRDLETGKAMLFQLKYEEAIKNFLAANEFNPDNAELNYLIGSAYLNTADKTKSLLYFEKAASLDTAVKSDIRLMLGKSYQLNMEFGKAEANYIKYKKSISPDKKEIIDAVNKRIAECENGKEIIKTPLNIKIENLGKTLNSPYTDYSPIISADESVVMFTSRREGTTGGIFDPYLNEYYEDIYISNFIKDHWEVPKNLGSSVNTERHDAIAGLSFDGQRLFIYRDNEKANGDIFESYLTGDKWSEPVKLPEPINTVDYSESTACLDYDGKTLYFVSDRQGKDAVGGRDIYMIEWNSKKKSWGVPKNLGKDVNTPYDEETPFMHPDGKTLYFSSKGHNSIGGYDIFKTTKKGRTWTRPQNIGYPINSTDDDLYLVVAASGKHAYYSSVKDEGFGRRDLYRISFIIPPSEPYQPELTLVKGVICDELTQLPIGAKIEITDNEKNEIIFEMDANSKTGKYLFSLPSGKNYGIAVTSEGFLFHSENFDLPVSWKYQEIEKNICLKKINVGETIILKNIFYDFDMATLRLESTAELERLIGIMNKIPTLKIEISGHTDSKGSDDYNQRLSESRAKSVVDYLIAHGIAQTRLEYKGYGEAKPIAENETDEGRQLNRRTEFKILEK